MFQAWISEEKKLWTSEEDKVTLAILKIWEVQEAKAFAFYLLVGMGMWTWGRYHRSVAEVSISFLHMHATLIRNKTNYYYYYYYYIKKNVTVTYHRPGTVGLFLILFLKEFEQQATGYWYTKITSLTYLHFFLLSIFKVFWSFHILKYFKNPKIWGTQGSIQWLNSQLNKY